MEPFLAAGIDELPSEVVLVLAALAIVLVILAVRIAIRIAIRVGIVALAVLGGLWALGQFADIHVRIF